MSKQRFLLLSGGLLLVAVVALWPWRFALGSHTNVTLVSFTAMSLPGQPEIYLEWETATEFDTLGFFIVRGDSFGGAFARVSDFIPHEGDTIVGAQYDWLDEDSVLNRTYLYQLEEITTNQRSEFYGPITVTAGIPATAVPPATHTPTPTPTRTRTVTPSPTATSTEQDNPVVVKPTTSSGSVGVVTPRAVTGATVTPRPVTSGSSSSPAVTAVAATPVLNASDPQQPPAAATFMPSVPAAVEATVVPPSLPVAVDIAQAPQPTLAPTDASPAIAAPVVVATEIAPAAAATGSTNASALLLVAAAFLFLGLAFVILRQARL